MWGEVAANHLLMWFIIKLIRICVEQACEITVEYYVYVVGDNVFT